MISEILEEPEVFSRTVQNVKAMNDEFSKVIPKDGKPLILTGNGTSYHACLLGSYALFKLMGVVGIPIYASELSGLLGGVSAQRLKVLVVSQSGESSDALAAASRAKKAGHEVYALTNHENSSLARLADGVFVTPAGEEVAVTATKTFLSQVITFLVMAASGKPEEKESRELLSWLEKAPDDVRKVLKRQAEIAGLAGTIKSYDRFFVLGSGEHYPIALEVSLKLKEAAGVFAQGYPSREFLHGPMQLLDPHTPVIGIGEIDESVRKAAEAYGAPLVGLPFEATSQATEFSGPVLATVAGQLLAFHLALERGLDPDKPSKLNKVVKRLPSKFAYFKRAVQRNPFPGFVNFKTFGLGQPRPPLRCRAATRAALTPPSKKAGLRSVRGGGNAWLPR